MLKSLNMIPMEYPWAYEMAKDMLANFWTPFEIEMGRDREDIATFTDNEMHIFRNALAYLTTSDIQIGDNVEMGTEPALARLGFTNTEIRVVTGIQTEQERRHSISYQHILESILSLTQEEQKEIYEIWEINPVMRAKVAYAATITEELTHNGNVADTIALLWWYYNIYEGAWFMGGFNPLFALSNIRGRIRGVIEQIRYIRNDETTHINFGQALIAEMLAKYPDEFERFKLRVQLEIHRAVSMEINWANNLIEKPIMGYSAHAHMQHFMHLLNGRCIRTKLPAPFPSVTQSPFPWLADYELRPEENFFERRVTQYQKMPPNFWEK